MIKMLTKAQLRSKILSRLGKQKEAKRTRKSKIIEAKLFRLEIVRKAKTIMFYEAFDGEVRTDTMIRRALLRGKRVLVPVCHTRDRSISPCRVGLQEKLKVGPYGVLEPRKKRYVPFEDIDVVIVPGVAFDKKGNRLGRGKGYYDRFLRRLPRKIRTIGLAFDFQILPGIPTNALDFPVDKVIFA